MLNRGAIILVLLFRFLFMEAQVPVSGIILDRKTGNKVAGATIQVDQHTSVFCMTDSTGHFRLSVPGLPCTLIIRHLSYRPLIQKISAGQTFPVELYLAASEKTLEEVYVAAPKNNARDNELRKISMRSNTINGLTSGFGEADIIRTLQSMPGIQKSSEINAALNVRGTGHGNNRIQFDGQDLLNSYHLLGIAPMFNPDILGSVMLQKSGFDARSGDALSSFLDVESRIPETDHPRFSASLSNLSGGIRYERPLISDKMSMLAAARYSYFDLVADIYKRLHQDSENFRPLPGYRLYDLFLRLHLLPGKNWKGDLTLFHTSDRFQYKTGNLDLRTDWKNSLYSLNLAKTLNPSSRISFHSGLSVYDFSGEYNPSWNILRKNNMLSWDNDAAYSHFNDSGLSWQAGAFSTMRRYTITSEELVVRKVLRSSASNEYSLYTGIYGNMRLPVNSWMEVEGGLRLAYYRHLEGLLKLAPRLQVNARQGRVAMNLSYDRTYQFAHLISPLGFNMPADLWYPAGWQIPPQQADQLALHLHYNTGIIGIDAGAFYKNMDNLSELMPGSELISFQPAEAMILGKGKAFGFESGLHMGLENVNLDLYYTWSRSRRYFDEINGGKAFSPPYDLPHQVDVSLKGKAGSSLSWNISWFLASGQVTTMPTGYAFLPHGGEAMPYPLYTELYNFRMPPSHRMDVALIYHWSHPYWDARLSTGVYNVYNNSNPYFLFFTMDELPDGDIQAVPQKLAIFPFTPFLSLKINWK